MNQAKQENYTKALKELLYKMADDQLILGHRNSEWTGLGPTLEEDIAFSSLAQDKIGHAYNLYQILEDLGEGDPDHLAFKRGEDKQYKCCHLVEYPIGEYDFSLVRHFYFDNAEFIRFEQLSSSSWSTLAGLAKKIRGEIKYHVFHANTWIKQLANGTDESLSRIQNALNKNFALALGMFEPGENEKILQKAGIFPGEEKIRSGWYDQISEVIEPAGLKLPDIKTEEPVYGGRKGFHTQHLQPLLKEMTEVFNKEPEAGW